MKRIISLVLALSMVFSVFSTVFAARKYTDLTGENAKYAGAVEALTELGVVDGFTDNTFGPTKELTRAQLAKMLVICLGLGDSVQSLTGRTVFSDVEASHWASGYINAAAQGKVITGYPDGTFKPEKNVSYAEAFTMALRALGYGNVVEAEGTWPTAYMLKAVELELTDDMEGTIVAGNPALRGNTAILLWNMLRTEMWKIYEESQGNGMTLYTNGDFMLNVKFPKYTYGEELYLTDVDVKDNSEVRATVSTLNANGELRVAQEAKLAKDTDISRLVYGMKVTALIKDYRDEDKATFLTLTPAYEFVEGLITSVKNIADGKIEIENEEYKLAKDADFDIDLAEDMFVVAEVEGKKIIDLRGGAVLKALPNLGTEVSKPSTLKSKIDEDALVIIDGKWATREDIEEGDVYTELEDRPLNTGDNYFMVARERVNGTFESLTYEKDDDQRMYFEVDGDNYRTFERFVEGHVYVDDDKLEDAVNKLTKKKKENDFLDKEVELALNYLGQVIKVYFEDIKGNGVNNFYAVMSNGVREVTDPDTGDTTLKIRLANGDDPEGTMYEFSSKFDLNDFVGSRIEKGVVYKNAADHYEGRIEVKGQGVFVWAKFNDKGQIKAIAVLEEGLEDDPYDDDFGFTAFFEDAYDKNSGYISTDDGEFKVTANTKVFKLTPEKDDEDEAVIGFKFEVAEDSKAAVQGVDAGLVAYDKTTKINKNGNRMTASVVFVTEDAVSSDLEVAKVEAVKQRAGVTYVKVNGDYEEVDLDNKKSIVDSYAQTKELDKSFIAFSRTESDKIVIKGVLLTVDLAKGNASVVTAVDGSIVQLVEGVLSGDIDLEDRDDIVNRTYEDYTMIAVTASVDKDGYVEFDDGEQLGIGLEKGKFSKGDRVVVDNYLEVIYIVTVEGVDEDDIIDEDGYVYYIDEDEEPIGPIAPAFYSISFAWDSETPEYITEVVELPEAQEVEEGQAWSIGNSIPDYTFEDGDHSGETWGFFADPITAVYADETVTVVATPANQ